MSFLIVPNRQSSFGIQYQNTDNLKKAIRNWYDKPDLGYFSSCELQKSIAIIEDLSSITEPTLIKTTSNIWYQVEDIEQYELNIIGSSKQKNSSKMVTQLFFFDGGTYIRQLEEPQALFDHSNAELPEYLNRIGLPANNIINSMSCNYHSGVIKYEEFEIQYAFVLDSLTKKQTLNELACLQIIG